MYGRCIAFQQKRTYAAWLLCGCCQVENGIFHLPLLMDVFSGVKTHFFDDSHSEQIVLVNRFSELQCVGIFTWRVSDCEELVVPSDGSSRQKLD